MVKTVSCNSKISKIYVPMGGIWVERVVPGAGAWRLQGALWRSGGRDQGSSPANSQLIMLISFPAKMYFSSQTTRICDLCCFCSVATNAKNVIMAATNCYCNHEKSAEPQFFFSCNSVVVVFIWPHPPALDLSPAFKMGPKFDPTEARLKNYKVLI